MSASHGELADRLEESAMRRQARQQRDELILKRYREGMSPLEIAGRFGVTRSLVRGVLERALRAKKGGAVTHSEQRRAALLSTCNLYLGHAINCLDLELSALEEEKKLTKNDGNNSTERMLAREKAVLFGTIRVLDAARVRLLIDAGVAP